MNKKNSKPSPKILDSRTRAHEDKSIRNQNRILTNELERHQFEESLNPNKSKIRFDYSLNALRMTSDFKTRVSVVTLYLPLRILKKDWMPLEEAYQLIWKIKNLLTDEEWLTFMERMRNVGKT